MFQKVFLLGNVGKDPEVKYTPSGAAVAKFSIATTEKRKGDDGKWEDLTEWHNIVAFGRTAEVVEEYVKKGKPVFIEGKNHTSSWEDKDSGKKMYRTEVIVDSLKLLGGKSQGGDDRQSSGGPRQSGNRQQSSSRPAQNQQRRQTTQQRQPPPPQDGTEITDDDIPF